MAATVGTAALTDPLTVPCGQTIPNRLMRSALSEALADPDGRPSGGLARLYGRWSQAGTHGLIVTGNVMVDRRHLGEPGNVVVEDDRHLDALAAWAAAGRIGGNRLWMQINHPGRQASPLVTGNRSVAPSAVASKLPGYTTPRALSHDEIEEIVGRYAACAAVAQRAGFDGVQLHGAHGYLISQFLSPLVNQRDDAWGGDPERRMRFVLEVLRAVRAAVGDDFPVAIKLNSADFQRGGFDEQESMAVVDRLASEGVDLVEVSGGTYGTPAMMGKVERESTRQREAYFQTYAEEVRRRTPGLPLALTGGFRTRTGMQAALDDGACDLVGLGRAPCVDPDVGVELLAGRREHAPVGDRRIGLRPLLGLVTDLRPLDGAIDLQWHTDQLHRMAAGDEPDPSRPWFLTALRMLRRFGTAGLRPKRG
ncbi:NADH:flavin oxidoreductase/NADH oxidase family protein [Patulibacter defluvii]|uniref:NADH:flavin oxidoreductase/NADH oxidase family protein n=1 Tax=Patulibacter defluvii TaxID=3095358 RepID=UPI002A74EEC8|nr:NADH:flavin oxidoreductase/NADH oxidase family protein [Patulibacter sp. DM4]